MPGWGLAARGAIGKYAGMAGKGLVTAWGTGIGKSMMLGAGVGGLYGGFSDNSSILGGVLKGATLGAGLYGAGVMGIRGSQIWKASRLRGMGRGASLAWTAQTLGRETRSLIGNTSTKAYNGFRALWK
jgi:hypothetical protein